MFPRGVGYAELILIAGVVALVYLFCHKIER